MTYYVLRTLLQADLTACPAGLYHGVTNYVLMTLLQAALTAYPAGLYYGVTISIVSLTTGLSVLTLNLHHRGLSGRR